MATIPVNGQAIVSTTSVTVSFAGFTVMSGSATFTGLKDSRDNPLATGAAPLIVPAGFTVPLYVTSASLSSGAVIFYL